MQEKGWNSVPELEELVDKEIRALISLSLCSGVELGLDCLSFSTLGSPSSNLSRDFPGMEQPSGFQWKLTDPIPCIQTQQGIGFKPSLLQENTTALETLPNSQCNIWDSGWELLLWNCLKPERRRDKSQQFCWIDPAQRKSREFSVPG